MLLLVLSGRADLEQKGQSLSAASGGMILYDQAQPFGLELKGPHRLAALSVSRSTFEQALSGPDNGLARVMSSETAMGAFAASTLAQFINLSQTLEQGVISKLAPSVLDIVATVLTAPEANSNPHLRKERLFDAAKAYVDRHLGEPLIVTLLADALGCSQRALNPQSPVRSAQNDANAMDLGSATCHGLCRSAAGPLQERYTSSDAMWFRRPVALQPSLQGCIRTLSIGRPKQRLEPFSLKLGHMHRSQRRRGSFDTRLRRSG